ncbi:MAG TPA: L,D-transpeptidase [Pseudonocardia sp.]
MLAATAAAALVALAAVMLTGAGGESPGAAPSDLGVLPAALPAAVPDAAAPGAPVSGAPVPDTAALLNDSVLGGAGAGPSDAASTTSGGSQTAQKGGAVAPGPAAAASRASAPAVRVSAKVSAPTSVDGTPCTSAASACVDVADREAWLINKGVVSRGPVQIMTGDQDDPTPIGTFHVQWKAEQYTSRQYLTQMPYSVFFADGGVAFHEGPQNTYSAGCVKLVHDDAVAFFNYLQVGDEVQVH